MEFYKVVTRPHEVSYQEEVEFVRVYLLTICSHRHHYSFPKTITVTNHFEIFDNSSDD